MREKQSIDDRKRIIQRKQNTKIDQQSDNSGSHGDGTLGDSGLTKGSGPTRQYMIDTRNDQN